MEQAPLKSHFKTLITVLWSYWLLMQAVLLYSADLFIKV